VVSLLDEDVNEEMVEEYQGVLGSVRGGKEESGLVESADEVSNRCTILTNSSNSSPDAVGFMFLLSQGVRGWADKVRPFWWSGSSRTRPTGSFVHLWFFFKSEVKVEQAQ
jgi:hypothetical protein